MVYLEVLGILAKKLETLGNNMAEFDVVLGNLCRESNSISWMRVIFETEICGRVPNSVYFSLTKR